MGEMNEQIIKHEEKIKTLFNRVDRLDRVVDKINSLALSIEKMAYVQQGLIEGQNKIKDDVEKIKEQPVKDAHDTKQKIIQAIITTVVGALVGALLALVIKK